jgi:hypothetical protein
VANLLYSTIVDIEDEQPPQTRHHTGDKHAFQPACLVGGQRAAAGRREPPTDLAEAYPGRI